MMKYIIYVGVSLGCVLCSCGSVFAQRVPTDQQESMMQALQTHMNDNKDTWTLQQNKEITGKLNILEQERGDEELISWFVIYSRTILAQMNVIFVDTDIPVVLETDTEIEENIVSEQDKNMQEETRIIQQLTVSGTEPGYLRVRAAPNTDSDIVGKLAIGESHQILLEQDDRYMISYDGYEGRVAGWYVDVQDIEVAGDYIDIDALPLPDDLEPEQVGRDTDALVLMDGETKSTQDAYKSLSMDDFVSYRYPLVHAFSKENGVPEACMLYYDDIDSIAREMNFPTALVISTWYREFDCRLENPTNTRGPFQVTSSYKAPGPITVDELIVEVREFIEFSRGKYEYYTKLWKFDEIPVSLSHDTVDLVSLQKHSILYNGMYSGVTPANSSYANQNFRTGDDNNRDGIVTMFLKIEYERRNQ